MPLIRSVPTNIILTDGSTLTAEYWDLQQTTANSLDRQASIYLVGYASEAAYTADPRRSLMTIPIQWNGDAFPTVLWGQVKITLEQAIVALEPDWQSATIVPSP